MKQLQKKLEEIFQDFHRHPEVSGKEVRTTEKIKEYLTEWNISLIDFPLPTGALAQIGTGNKPVAALRCDLDASTFSAPPPLVNNADLAIFATETARSLGIRVIQQEPSMIGEDFAEYLQEKPGCFVRVGTGIGPGLHHSKFRADSSALSGTAKFLAELVIRRLEKMSGSQNGKES